MHSERFGESRGVSEILGEAGGASERLGEAEGQMRDSEKQGCK